jgi:O-antigen ligase
MVGRTRPWAVPGLLVGVAWMLLVFDLQDILTGWPLGGPFGYQNATGAFFFQASVAGLMLAVSPTRARAVIGIVAAVAFAAVPLVSGSITAGVLVLSLPAWVVARRGPNGARAAVATCAVLVLSALVLTAALGAAYEPGERTGALDRLADATLTERRLVLWGEALDMMTARPLTGIGPGRFDQVSPSALQNVEIRWAHHGFLQQGAETGLPGLVLLVLLFLWGFARLRLAGPPNVMTGLGAVALAGLGIHATVDYVLHFAAIPLAAAALVGAATISSPKEINGNQDADS